MSTQTKQDRKEAIRWWIKLLVQPALVLAAGAIVIVALGVAQRVGWISSGGVGHAKTPGSSGSTRFICPMMCTPPQSEPGRCPVCAMELVPATSSGGSGDAASIEIDPAARRVANIRTVAVKSVPLTRKIRAIGQLNYDEGTLKTISAYVDGRIDRLYADYTGIVVKKDDHMALVYSPRLYSSQVELLLARQARKSGQLGTSQRMVQSNLGLYEGSKQRLIEFGMTGAQIEQLEQAGEASSRLHLCAPISGTVIEKFVVEGEYVKEGQPICRLADLTTVWLMLELFPEDAAIICYGQKVNAEVQSLPGKEFTGRVAFVDPTVDPKTRTVGVRVVIPNEDGLLRVGDYAKATLDVAVGTNASQNDCYDPELANKWISPRHPHVVESSPGKCRVCGVELVPAAEFGFTDQPNARCEALVVPRNAVLMAGVNSVVYVETEPGRFELRHVVLGPSSGGEVVIRKGVKKDEQVATRGNFLIDSQMQLAGNPSLIDPTKAEPKFEFDLDDSELPPIGSLEIASLQSDLPQMQLMQMEAAQAEAPLANSDEAKEIAEALAQLSPADRKLAEKQEFCPVADMPLGSMGAPIKVDVNGTPVFICCQGCRQSLLAQPVKYLAKLTASAHESPEGMGEPPLEIGAIQENEETVK